MTSYLLDHIASHRAVLDRMLLLEPAFSQVVSCVVTTIERGGKILLCGNGGSAADAQHIAAELVGRFRTERRALAALALTTDSSILTAVGNDYAFDDIFSRQVAAFGSQRDVLWVLSTSGTSKNIIRALEVAKENKCMCVGFLGKDGGDALSLCDHALVVPSKDTARIQEMHMLMYHAVCDAVDQHIKTLHDQHVSV